MKHSRNRHYLEHHSAKLNLQFRSTINKLDSKVKSFAYWNFQTFHILFYDLHSYGDVTNIDFLNVFRCYFNHIFCRKIEMSVQARNFIRLPTFKDNISFLYWSNRSWSSWIRPIPPGFKDNACCLLRQKQIENDYEKTIIHYRQSHFGITITREVAGNRFANC